MPSRIVRVSESARRYLGELAEKQDKPMQAILDEAVEAYRRKCLLEEANEAYRALRNDPKAWKTELEERRAWDIALSDGLEED
jgi:hypothetical protein